MTTPSGPTLDDIRQWPAVVDVTMAARALGVSRSTLYEQIRGGVAPVRVLRIGARVKVITSSVLKLLGDPLAREIA